ncbi:MAG: NAD-dependent DNA ligase LigA [Candidatus Paceibacterota bacterium]|jgi:DNA ligase (NAD+)
MEKKEIQTRIAKLQKLIIYHQTRYYTFDEPEISDAAFDALKEEFEELENKYPEFASQHSPTNLIGGVPLEKFQKVKHEHPMFSLQDAFNVQEMNDWIERISNFLKISKEFLEQNSYYCELKIDGLAIELIYKKGILVCASTRGDGKIGEDVTQNISTIKSIPQTLTQLGSIKIPDELIVRGEVFLSKKELKRVNSEQENKGLKPYANTRNLAAGSLRQLDSQITASRRLESFQYDIVGVVEEQFQTHEEKHKALASWGFTINSYNSCAKNINEALKVRDIWERKREALDYEIDGIVIILNDSKLFNSLGTIGKTPRGAIAYKFIPREAITVVLDIRVQIGRTGVLTPVADLRPVLVGGAMIAHATLHNADEIERLGLRIGDTVVISRAGDVIPKITRVIKELRNGKEKKFSIPNLCPIDGSKVIVNGALHQCSNESCGARHKEALYHFVSRHAFNIRGLGAKIIDRFIDEGLIVDAGDIFALAEGDIKVLERFGDKSAENIIKEVKQKKIIQQAKFIFALGIIHVGEETARVIAEQFPVSSISKLITHYSKIKKEEWELISDIGPKVSTSIVLWFENKKNIALLKKLDLLGVSIIPSQKKKGRLFLKTFVLTGTMESLSREEAKEKIISLGGSVSESVSRNTSFVVSGANSGSKLKKAKELNVPILSEIEFLKLIQR